MLNKNELLELIEEGFQKPAWHGPNLWIALRGVTAKEAIWRPENCLHNIWEIVVHAAYWKYTVTNRLTGGKEHRFPERGSNWFSRDGVRSSGSELDKCWVHDLELLARMHKELCSAITVLKDTGLKRPMRGSQQTAVRNLVGIAMHDVYHAGQIQLLRKLYRSRTDA